MKTLNCYTYWNDKNIMPSLIKYIYNYNVKFASYYNFKLILITDSNVKNYINVPDRFWKLNNEFKSEIIRFLILDKYGGLWLNPEIVIIKNLNKLYNHFIKSGKKVMVDIELPERISCASIMMLPNSTCSKYCVNYIINTLNTINNIMWDDIAYNTIRSFYELYPNSVLINDNKVTHLVCWDQKPEFFKQSWEKQNINEAKEIGQNIINNLSCHYISTSYIYKENDINNVFNNENSIFYYIIREINNIKLNNNLMISIIILTVILICIMFGQKYFYLIPLYFKIK
jgi:hypothetical protein